MSGRIVYQCRLCEKVHEGLPAIAYDSPAHYHDLAEPERAARAILTEAHFKSYRVSFGDDDQSKLGPMFSWFASRLPGYPDTLNLKCNVVPRDGGQRPLIEFAPDDEHPLVLDWKNGITLERAIEFVVPVLHKH